MFVVGHVVENSGRQQMEKNVLKLIRKVFSCVFPFNRTMCLFLRSKIFRSKPVEMEPGGRGKNHGKNFTDKIFHLSRH